MQAGSQTRLLHISQVAVGTGAWDEKLLADARSEQRSGLNRSHDAIPPPHRNLEKQTDTDTVTLQMPDGSVRRISSAHLNHIIGAAVRGS